MPPVRTAASLVDAVAHDLALSSHGAGYAPSLVRGTACGTCKKRKLRCDGARPVCGGCARSAKVHGDDPGALAQCVYPDPRPRAAPLGKVQRATLEAEIAELKATVEQLRQANASATSASSSTPALFFSSAPGPDEHDATRLPRVPADFPLDAPSIQTSYGVAPFAFSESSARLVNTQSASPRTTGPTPSGEMWSSYSTVPPTLSPSATLDSATSATSPFTPPSSDPFLDLLYPGWPRDLPPPSLVHRIIDVYFSRPHQCSDVINPSRFRTALSLPPTSAGFPHPGLIHVMCAIACLMVPDDFFRGESCYWRGYSRAADYHIARCKIALEEGLVTASMFDSAQVFGLLCFWLYSQARWVEVWQYCAQATRVTLPLGLNHIRAASDPSSDPTSTSAMLKDTDDEAVLRERALTFFLAFTADRFASASTGWACSLDKADITTTIPGEGQTYPRGDDVVNSPFSLHHPAFFLAHGEGCGPLQLSIKAVVLLGDVVQFQSRAPYASKMAPQTGFALNDRISDVRSTDSFRRLDSTVRGFIASIPREYQFRLRPLGTSGADILDETRLCLVHGMAHTSVILLHEPHVAALDEHEPSFVRCLESANEILQGVFLILGTSYDVALFSPFFTYVVACAGRTFVRQIAIRVAKGATHGIDELKSNVNTILYTLKAHRTPLGDNAHAQLSMMLDDPLRCLPRPFLALASDLSPPLAPGAHSAYDLTRRDPMRPPCTVEPLPATPAPTTSTTRAARNRFGIVELERGPGADEPLLRELVADKSLVVEGEWFGGQGFDGVL
ncbi:hypothetical protein JCM3775_002052 [Rhodotorula graminis]